ncbi:hypothetical protein D3C72_1524510 [compost metagenome]
MSFENLAHLKEYHFLLSPSIQDETALGVYSDEKKGTDYNLLHWFNHDGEKSLHYYKNPVPEKKRKKLVSTLKPAICYYFLSKYFEDFIHEIFINNKYSFISNHSFFIENKEFTEVDFLVQTPQKLIYIEAKTKLTKLYIETFLKRASKLIDRFKPMYDAEINIEFLLVASFSDQSVVDYQYFIDSSGNKEDGYNIPRNGLNCIPYLFDVPIPDKEGKIIKVVAEPEFDKLQDIILKICPK